MKSLAVSALPLLLISALVSYLFKANFAVALAIVLCASLVGLIVHGRSSCAEFCMDAGLVIVALLAVFIVAHYFPAFAEIGLYNLNQR